VGLHRHPKRGRTQEVGAVRHETFAWQIPGRSGVGKVHGLSWVSPVVDPRRANADGQSEARNGLQ
jgi:hypothetical protein